MTTTRGKTDSPQFKARVAGEAIRGEENVKQLAFAVQGSLPCRFATWRKAGLEQAPAGHRS